MNVADFVPQGIPLHWFFGAAGTALILITGIAWLAVLKRTFRKRLEAVVDAPERARELIHRKHGSTFIAMRSGVIETVARTRGAAIVSLSGADRIWIRRAKTRARQRDIRRVLEFIPDTGLFACFSAALRKRRAATILLDWLDESDDLFALQRIALSAPGETFDGAAALELLGERLDRIREMTGDPQWPPRFFAVNIMLHSDDERSVRGVWSAFDDTNRFIREMVARDIQTDDTDELYRRLFDLYLHDPVFEVRRAARRRLDSQFADRYRVDRDNLSETEALHIMGLLEQDSSEDEALAMTCLSEENLELALPAARYLQKAGVLSRLFRNATFSDPDDFERIRRLLTTAATVHVTGFLSELHHTARPAPLMLAARVLERAGDSRLIAVLARSVFALPFDESRQDDVYAATLTTIAARGTESALELLRQELWAHRYQPDVAGQLLESVPPRAQPIVMDTALSLLRDPEFSCRDALHALFARFEGIYFLPALLDILQSGSDADGRPARVSAVKILTQAGLPYARQYLLESLSTIPPDEARELAALYAESAGDDFAERVWEIINGRDGDTRAALIAILPAVQNKSFLKPIREAVHDADPRVRTAAIWALLEFGDSKSFNQAVDRLRDPVERVRIEAATALGAHGTAATLQEVRQVLEDEQEVDDVKRSAIAGLARSEQKQSIAILTDLLERDDHWDDVAIEALAHKRTAKHVGELVQQLKDGSPRLREKLMRSFRRMGTDGEQAMLELLEQDIPALRPHVTEILEQTGFVEETVRKMAHRDSVVRRDAAEALSAIATLAAFRGIVLAARDPDPEVRVRVTRALEKLDTEEGKSVLSQLENDPERRVRKFTLWALERYRARDL